MQTSDWLQVLGWVVTFILGIFSAVVVQRIMRKRAIIAWTVLSENSIFSSDAVLDLGVSVQVAFAGKLKKSLSVVNIRLGSRGNEVIENVAAAVKLNAGAEILRVRLLDDLGEFAQHVKWDIKANRAEIKLEFLNPEHKKIDVELLIGGYELGTAEVDLSAPGVILERRNPSAWDIQTSAIRSLALSIAGIRFEPTVTPLEKIAEEMRLLRRHIRDRAATRTPSETLDDKIASQPPLNSPSTSRAPSEKPSTT